MKWIRNTTSTCATFLVLAVSSLLPTRSFAQLPTTWQCDNWDDPRANGQLRCYYLNYAYWPFQVGSPTQLYVYCGASITSEDEVPQFCSGCDIASVNAFTNTIEAFCSACSLGAQLVDVSIDCTYEGQTKMLVVLLQSRLATNYAIVSEY
jgi:hypothetical protein